MNQLQQIARQIAHRYRALAPSGRVAVFGALGVAALSLVYLLAVGTRSQDYYLFGGRPVRSEDWPAIEAALARKRLNGYTLENGLVRVPAAQKSQYIAAIADAGALPEEIGSDIGLSEGISIWTDPKEKEERIKAARQRNLGRIIGEMQGIARAYVIFDRAKQPGLKQEIKTVASVALQTTKHQRVDPQRVRQIQHLVASAFAGLNPNEVTVVDLDGQFYLGGSNGSGGGSGDYLATMQAFQQLYQNAVTEALVYVPGAVATVNVELDKRLRDEVESVKNVPEQEPWIVRENHFRTGRPATAMRPFEASGTEPAELFPVDPPLPAAEEKQIREEQKVLSQERSLIAQAGLTPWKITVSVAVPVSYYQQVWLQQHPNSLGQPTAAEASIIERDENAKIRRAVAQAIGCDKPELAMERITVNSFPVFPKQAQAPVHAANPTWAQWRERAAPLIASAITVLLLIVVWRSVKWGWGNRGRSQPQPVDPEPFEPENPALAARRELTETIHTNPDAAAATLRNWIAKAG